MGRVWYMKINKFFNDYRKRLDNALKDLSLDAACQAIEKAIQDDRNIFVCGNGGSAAIAEHFTCDHSKGVNTNTNFKPKYMCLNSNVSLLTAYANDYGYQYCFSKQLELFGREDDLLITISSSGKSANIFLALSTARDMKMKTISLTGFDGGPSKVLSDINIHVKENNYGIVEDGHQIIMHNIAQFIRTKHTTVDINSVKL